MKLFCDVATSLPLELTYLNNLIERLERFLSHQTAADIHLQIQSLRLCQDTCAEVPGIKNELFSYTHPDFSGSPNDAFIYVLSIDDQDNFSWNSAIAEMLASDPQTKAWSPGRLRIHDQANQREIDLLFELESAHEASFAPRAAATRDIPDSQPTSDLKPTINLLRSIQSLDKALMAGQSLDRFAEAALECVFTLLPDIQRVSITTLDFEENTCMELASRALNAKSLIPGGITPLKDLVITPTPHDLTPAIVEDIQTIERLTPVKKALLVAGVYSFINVPLFYNDTVFGRLNVGRAITGPFGQDFIEVASLIALRLALAIQRNGYEEELKKSEESYRFLTQNITDLIVKVDNEGRFLFVNEPYCKAFGRTEKDLLDSDFMPLVHPDDRAPTMEAMQKLYAPPYRSYMEQRALTKNGWRWLAWLDTAVLGEDGKVESIIGVGRDITEQKEAEAERKKIEAQMQHGQKLESLGVLAGGIAHDFNNLLTSIMGNASLVLLDLPPNAPSRIHLDQIELASERAGELCKQMLAYSGKGQFIITPMNLTDIVKEMTNFLKHSISKKARLNPHLDQNLPAIEGDPNQIRQVIMNLITNASEALGDKPGVITIKTGVTECAPSSLDNTYISGELTEGRYVYVEVADTGHGMSPETLNKIFDPFFTTKFTGRGLGLAAVLGIVHSHQGALKVVSTPDKGTLFRILLPSSDLPVTAHTHYGANHKPDDSEGTILVIDDEEAVRSIATQSLQRHGYKVILARDGREGIDLYQQHSDKISAVLLDLTMPQMAGKETFREIRLINPDVPIVLTSGYTMQDATRTFGTKDLAGFLQKPYNAKEIIRKVRNALVAEGGRPVPTTADETPSAEMIRY